MAENQEEKINPMTTDHLIEQIRFELQRIHRPLAREEFSYIPGSQQLSDRVTGMTLENNTPVLLRVRAKEVPISLSHAVNRGWLDDSDLQALLYMIQQIH